MSPRDKELLAAIATIEQFFADTVIPVMIRELEQPDLKAQRAAIAVLREGGVKSIGAIPALLAFFERNAGSDDAVMNYARNEAAYAIKEIRHQAQLHAKSAGSSRAE